MDNMTQQAQLSQSYADASSLVTSSSGNSKPKTIRSLSDESIRSMTNNGVTKPKQSKSRNGCVTCKAKRLKCDEAKPSCAVCAKRGVACGGYKKDFKWRPFEEANLAGKTPKTKGKVNKQKKTTSSSACPSPALSDASFSPMQSPLLFSHNLETYDSPSPPQSDFYPYSYPHSMSAPNTPGFFDLDDSYPLPRAPYSPPEMQMPRSHPPFMASFEDQHISPRLQDLLLPGSDMNRHTPIPEAVDYPITPRDSEYDSMMNESLHSLAVNNEFFAELNDEIVEEVVRSVNPLTGSTEYLSAMTSSTGVGTFDLELPQVHTFDNINDFLPRSTPMPASAEMLVLHFDQHTSGVMSIKNGSRENPWRTMIWPLALTTPALYHAILSMTAFHMSKDQPQTRLEGMEYMRKSILSLASGLGSGIMRADAALATTLVLAFAESWDKNISTGVQHLHGAKILVNQAILKHNQQPLQGEDLQRLKFLYNTYVYMDTLARLTSDHENEIVLEPMTDNTTNVMSEIDPLMGCATTLFPLISECANLVNQVRKLKKNTLGIISKALDLKTKIEEWTPEPFFETPEDTSSTIACCQKTAEAYRYATLLYLHQAVPEIPSLTSHELAEKIMLLLASIPTTSRICIVHIFPLLSASCEAVTQEERDWVQKRWTDLDNRSWIGNVDKAWEVIQEVWARRDRHQGDKASNVLLDINAYHSQVISRACTPSDELEDYMDILGNQHMHRRHMSSTEPGLLGHMPWKLQTALRRRAVSESMPIAPNITSRGRGVNDEPGTPGDLEFEMTIRGHLHWISVMKEWSWEVLLG